MRTFFIIALMLVSFPLFAASESATFITVSDIHFDPLQSCYKLPKPCPLLKELKNSNYQQWDAIFKKYSTNTQSRYGQDADYFLVESSLNYMKIIAEEINPQFVLILGDFLAHNFHSKYKKFSKGASRSEYRKFVKETMQFLTYKINTAFPNASVYPALGNNDSYSGNYTIVPKGNFLKDLNDIWADMIKQPEAKSRFKDTFALGGYYTAPLTEKLQLVMLDTVLFSTKNQNEKVALQAKKQLAWLREVLLSAEKHKQTVLMGYHIPAALETPIASIKEFWDKSYQIEFSAIIKQYSPIITAILPGHIHIDLVQFIVPWKNIEDIPIIYTPAISPIYGNNPAFKVFSYDTQTYQLENIDTYYLQLKMKNAEWKKEYSLNPL